MALPIIPTSTMGGRLGQAFSTGLQSLADLKLKELQQRQQASQSVPIYESLGLDQRTSQALANAPAANQRDVLKALLGRESPLVSLSVGGQPQQLPSQQGETPEQLPPAPQGLSLQQYLQSGKRNPQHQARIEAANKPFLDTFRPEVDASKKLNTLAQQAIDIIGTGKSQEGFGASLLSATPATASQLSNESQELLAIYNEIAELLAARRKGPQTAARIRLANSIKANLGQSKAVQLKRLEKVLADAQPLIEQDAIREQLIAANNDQQPANLEGKVHKAYRLQQLGNPKDYEEDTIVNLDGVRYKPNKSGTDWEVV